MRVPAEHEALVGGNEGMVTEELRLLVKMLTVRSGEDDAYFDDRFARGIADLTALFDARLEGSTLVRGATQLARYLATGHRPALALAVLHDTLRSALDLDADERAEEVVACRDLLAVSESLSVQAESLSAPLRSSLRLAILGLIEVADCRLRRDPIKSSDFAMARSYAILYRPVEALERLKATLQQRLVKSSSPSDVAL